MSPKIIEKIVYTFDELSDEAKERARSWWREDCMDHNWWDSTYDDAEAIANILGITFDQKAVPRMDGKFNNHPKIYFSGFNNQGDGACFEGTYRYAPDWKKALLAHAPTDGTLLKIGEDLQSAQASAFYQCVARTKHRGHYNHSKRMEVELPESDEIEERVITAIEKIMDEGLDPISASKRISEIKKEIWGPYTEAEEGITQALRDFADWIYDSLRNEYEYQMSDECVDENIKCNEFDFDVNGRIV